MNSEIPEIDNCCEKEIYAFFGLASYSAQVIEAGVINLAVVLRVPEVNVITRDQFDELYNSLGKRTFGQLLKIAKPLIELSDTEERILDEALELRNMLIHRYFSERAEEFMSRAGQNDMKVELQSIIGKFTEADNIIERIYLPLWKKYGVTEEFVESEMERVYKDAALRDKNA